MQDPNVAAPPHGLIGLEQAPELWQSPWVWALAAFIILSGIFAYTRWRRRKPRKAAAPRDPWQEICERVENLGDIAGDRREDVQAYYGQLSLLFREGLEQRFGFGATGQTLEELRRSLEGLAEVPAERKKEWLSFLEKADRIKFAEGLGTAAEHRSWRQEIGAWIRQWREGA